MKFTIKNIANVLPALTLLFFLFAGSASQANADILKPIKCPICQKVAKLIIHGVKSHLGSIDSGISKKECPKISQYFNEKDCGTLISTVINDAVNSSNLSPVAACRAVHYC